MQTFIFTILFLAVSAFVITRFSRGARLRQFAGQNQAQFESNRSGLVTELAAAKLDFLRDYLHTFRHVITYTDSLQFVRLSDVETETQTQPRPPLITVMAVEFKNAVYPALKVCPPLSPFAATRYPAIRTTNERLNAAYRFAASSEEAGCLLTPPLLALLATNPHIYLEINGSAMIYHEHRAMLVSEYPFFKLRAMQLADDIARILLNPQISHKPALPDALEANHDMLSTDAHAQSLLQALSPVRAAAAAQPGKFKTVLSIILLMVLILAPLFSWIILRRFLQN